MSWAKSSSVVLCAVLFGACFYLSYVLSLIPRKHIIFSVSVALYGTFANQYIRLNAPSLISNGPSSPPIAPSQSSVRLLFPFTFFFSLVGPTVILLLAVANGLSPPDSQIHSIVAPPLFLMMAQILCETVAIVTYPYFTVYIRFAATLTFVSYRITFLFAWYSQSLKWVSSAEAAALPSHLVVLAQATALLNIVFWTFSLLCFLLLYCLPSLVREPFEQDQEPTQSKTSPSRIPKKDN